MSDVENHSTPLRRQRLTQKQERRLVDYLEGKFLNITGNYKKRTDPSSSLQKLSDYLDATRSLLSVILQIPPIDPQASLRTAFLLRLTGDFLTAVPGYPPNPEILPELLDWLDELDRGWLAVLRAQIWDTSSGEGVDLQLSPDSFLNREDNRNDALISEAPRLSLGANGIPLSSTPVSQTDRARLRSLLMLGSDRLEEWMENLHVEGAKDVEAALDFLGLRESFEEIFMRTLSEMGELS